MSNTSLWIRTGLILAVTLAGFYLVFGPRRVQSLEEGREEGRGERDLRPRLLDAG